VLFRSLQDQWDRYEARKIVNQYEALGDEFLEDDQFQLAEEAYQKAFHFSDEKRLDIEMKRLQAKISRINLDPSWDSKPPDDLEDVDFQFLLHLQRGLAHSTARIATLNSYGIFLAAKGKSKEAEYQFKEAISIDSTEVHAYINLGNLMDQQGNKEQAEQLYRKSLRLDPENARASYNLGLLYVELGKIQDARVLFERAQKLDPGDEDIVRELKNLEKK